MRFVLLALFVLLCLLLQASYGRGYLEEITSRYAAKLNSDVAYKDAWRAEWPNHKPSKPLRACYRITPLLSLAI